MLDRRFTQEEEVEEKALMEKERQPEDLMETSNANVVDDGEASRSSQESLLPAQQTSAASPSAPAQRTGRWTPDEKILFLYGLKRFGKGRWKKMSIYLPHRSLVQIKSHAQKVLKRLETGENVFRRLEENYSIVDSLIVQAAQQRDALGDSKSLSAAAKRKRQNKRSQSGKAQNQQHVTADSASEATTAVDSGKSDVIAAAALCQLSSLRASWDQQQ